MYSGSAVSTRYIALAKRADEHLRQKKYISDTSEGVVQNFRSIYQKIRDTRDQADDKTCVVMQGFQDLFPNDSDINAIHSYILKKISKQDQTYVGNCGEKTFHAYNHLLKKLVPGDRIAMIVVENTETGKNHTFILLNPDLTLDQPMPDHPNYFLISNHPRDWGRRAVIYDPTYHTVHQNNDDALIVTYEKQKVFKESNTVLNTYKYFHPCDPELLTNYQFAVVLCNFNSESTNLLVLKENLKRIGL